MKLEIKVWSHGSHPGFQVQFLVSLCQAEVSSWPQEPFTSLLCANKVSFHKSNGDANIVILTIWRNCAFLPWVPDCGGGDVSPTFLPCGQTMFLPTWFLLWGNTQWSWMLPTFPCLWLREPNHTSTLSLRNPGYWLVKNGQQWHNHWK